MENGQKQPGIGNIVIGMVRLMRPLNGLITALSIASMGLIADVPGRLVTDLVLASIAGFLMTGFGNASNDYLDIEIDKINRPARPLPSGQVLMRHAVTVIIVCLFSAVAIGFYLGPIEFLFITVTAAMLAGYNALLKRVPLVGNITVGLLTGMAFVFGGIAVGEPAAALYPALFALCINVLRELLKDAEDIEGDMLVSVITYPKRYGLKATRTLASVIAALLIVLTAIPYAAGIYNQYYAMAVLAGVDLPLAGGMLYLRNHFSKQRIKRMSIFLKYLMILGLISILIGAGNVWG